MTLRDLSESEENYEEEWIPDNGTGVETEDYGSNETINAPFDPTNIRLSTKLLTIDLLLSRIEDGAIDLAPDFQRKAGIWKSESRSKLIESILIRIPLPAFYMDATNDEKWLVVDGLQRLTTLKEFAIDKTLRLSNLDYLKQLEGKTYSELHRMYQRRINETQVTMFLIEQGTPDEVKFNIFKRINTGGLPLSGQEIRHALNQGKASKLLLRLANTPEFKKAIDNGISDDRMADRECVLRFLAFTMTPYTQYEKDLDSFLNKSMAAINKLSDGEIEQLRKRFLRAMIAAYDIFGRDAFRKRFKPTAPRSPINKALFESWSINLSKLSDEQIRLLQARKTALQNAFIKLMHDSAFHSAISQGTGDIGKVKLRFSAIEQLIQEVLA
ncbi:MAG TPA: DUF262 domain-containing protein [Ktedonosporobacter sp.]|jgi:hypothetical protein|nr:DUF262 domain-containing protein [Ktedonosporobacter sp.]